MPQSHRPTPPSFLPSRPRVSPFGVPAANALAVLVVLAMSACDGGETGDGDVATLVPALTISNNALSFGAVYVGDTRTLTIELTSTGTAGVNLDALTLSPASAPFSILSQTPPTLAPTETTTIEIFFSPALAMTSNAILSIPNDVEDGAVIAVTLTGTGLDVPDCDDGNPCTNTVFDIAQEQCVTIQLDTSCDDGNACTENDRCAQGVCIGVTIQCVDDDNPCTIGFCDPQTGCRLETEDALCDDDNPCTDDQCDANLGCLYSLRPEFSLCGPFVQCQDASVCIEGVCIARPVENGTPCNDENACTADDICIDGSCDGARVQRPPELVAEIQMLDDGIEVEPDVSPANLQLNDTHFILPGDALQVVEVTPDPQDASQDQIRLVSTNLLFDDTDFVHVVNQGLVVVFDYGTDALKLYDYTDLSAPILVDEIGFDEDALYVVDDRVLICDDDDVMHFFSFDSTSGIVLDGQTDAMQSGCDDSEFAVSATHFANAGSETSVELMRIAPDIEATHLGVVDLPSTTDTTRTANVRRVALSPETYVVHRRLTESVVGQPDKHELLFGSIPTVPVIDGGDFENTGVVLSLDAYTGGLELLSMVGNAARVIMDEQIVDILPTGEFVNFINVPPLDDIEDIVGDVIFFDDDTGSLAMGRLSDNLFRRHVGTFMPPVLNMGVGGNDIYLFSRRGFVKTTVDNALAGAPMSLSRPNGLVGNDQTLMDFPGGITWTGTDTIRDGSNSNLSYDRLQIDSTGGVFRSPIESVPLLEAFGLSPLVEPNRFSTAVDVDGCQGAIAIRFEDGNETRLIVGMVSVCGPSTFIPYAQIEVDASFVSLFGFLFSNLSTTLRIHGSTHCSLTHLGRTMLFDFSDPALPAFVANVEHVPGGLADNSPYFSVDVGFDRNKLVMARTYRGSTPDTFDDVLVVDVSAGTTSTYPLPRWDLSEASPLVEEDSPAVRVLSVDFPRAFIRTSRFDAGAPRNVVEIVNISQPEATLDARVNVEARPVDAEIIGDKLFVATRRGVATISPPCGPTD